MRRRAPRVGKYPGSLESAQTSSADSVQACDSFPSVSNYLCILGLGCVFQTPVVFLRHQLFLSDLTRVSKVLVFLVFYLVVYLVQTLLSFFRL